MPERIADRELVDRAQNETLDSLEAFRSYLEKRRLEICEAMSPGVGLETWDPYLSGFAQGMRTGLEIAEDLVYAYSEWIRRGIPYPDEHSPMYAAR